MIDRFSIRAAALSALLVMPLFVPSTAVNAAAPAVGTPAPGYQRIKFGDFEITAISDGFVMLSPKMLLKNTTPARIDAALGSVFLKDPVSASVNAYVINTGTKLVLIDTGAGGLFGPTLGRFLENFKASGYQPEQIDEIYLTHFHPDHVGGLIAADGTAAFPNAVVRADKRESDYWLSEANMKAAPKDGQGFFVGAQKSLKPYVDAGKFKPFTGNVTLTPGISAISTIGHTPGHVSYVVTSQGKRLVLWGDLVHVAAVQFPNPAVAIAFDTNTTQAIAQRKHAFAEAAATGEWVAASHMAFPGLGHVVRNASGYAWIPANYEPIMNAK